MWAFVAVVLLGAGLAWMHRFVQDDAFITFRYAEHWVQGHGPRYNPGEPAVEGYSDFAWLVLIALGMRAGLDPVPLSQWLGGLAYLGTMVAVFRVGRLVMRRDGSIAIAALLLVGNYSFSAYVTGGLETQLQTCLVTWVWFLVARAWTFERWTVRTFLVVSSLVAAAAMTRLDSLLLVGVVGLIGAVALVRSGARGRGRVLAAWIVPGALVLLSWTAWKWSYYGEIVPNTYWAKTASPSPWRGLSFLWLFGVSYLIAPALVAVVGTAVIHWRRIGPAPGLALAAIPAWCAYVVRIGGDFMEFRFLVPVLPMFFVLLGWALEQAVGRVVKTVLVVATLAGSVRHAVTFERTHFVWDVPLLHDWVWGTRPGLVDIGGSLGGWFGGTDVTIALTPAGAPAYYSGLRTVDMYGLNDAWVARHGIVVSDRPAHQRLAPVHYLVEQGVHLVIGTPHVVSRGLGFRVPETREEFEDYFRLVDEGPVVLPPGARILEMPTGERMTLLAVYLQPHPAIDALIADGTLRARPIPIYAPEDGRLLSRGRLPKPGPGPLRPRTDPRGGPRSGPPSPPRPAPP